MAEKLSKTDYRKARKAAETQRKEMEADINRRIVEDRDRQPTPPPGKRWKPRITQTGSHASWTWELVDE